MSNGIKETIELIDNLIGRFEMIDNIYNIDKRLSNWFLYDLKELKKMVEELKWVTK